MNFQEVCKAVVKQATDKHMALYVYRSKVNGYNWIASHTYWDDWLFRARPNGKSDYSFAGAKLLQTEKESIKTFSKESETI